MISESEDVTRGAITAPEAVNKFLTENPSPTCSDCIARALGMRSRCQPGIITAALATTKEFVRGLGYCTSCKREKMVTRRS
jgi:hypothetical protein